ncbi:M20 family metallopeptidase [Amycolatopsis palatopharyngis]|uniref:M20 family metallopeptidase n=1 Tax=Amycolatopsis palatopharyngis TaxID=187982 RepID=UPI000E23FC53|nr:M20 family metallopeptidase [Amycolatopsis palatopharyngis]
MDLHSRIERRIAHGQQDAIRLSHLLHANPEVAWEEVRASTWVAGRLDDLGYEVTSGVCDLPTAFRARIGTGPLHIGICAEYDALPGLGHACGHNIIAASAVAAAAALAPVVDDAGLTVSILGTPAEEGGGGKILMLERGAFAGIHAAMMVHPGPVDVAEADPFAVAHLNVKFHGKAAHAAAYPEHGINAADAFTVSQVAIGLLRQQLPHSTRVHGILTNGGEAPNAIPESTEGRWYVRASTLDELLDIEPRVLRCFEAGALATGCELEIEPESAPYSEFLNDPDLVAAYRRNSVAIGRRYADPGPASRMNRASTDMGNVSRVLPAIHPYIGIDSLPAVNHQQEFAAHCISPAADNAVLDAAAAMAFTAVDLALDTGISTRLTS